MTGTKQLLLLPGMDGTGDNFVAFVAVLPTDVRAKVVRYPSDAARDFERYVEHVQSLLTPDCVLVAESFSGPIAIAVAVRDPRVSRVVLVATFCRFPRPALRVFTPLAGPMLSRKPPGFVLQQLLGKRATAAERERLSASIMKNAKGVLKSRLALLCDVDVRQELAQLTQPVLCLRATRDRLVPSHNADEMVRLNERVEVANIVAPHLLLQRAPREAWRAITAWMSTWTIEELVPLFRELRLHRSAIQAMKELRMQTGASIGVCKQVCLLVEHGSQEAVDEHWDRIAEALEAVLDDES